MTNYVTLKEGEPIQTWYWECDKCEEYGHSNPEDLEVEEEAEWHANICGSKYVE